MSREGGASAPRLRVQTALPCSAYLQSLLRGLARFDASRHAAAPAAARPRGRGNQTLCSRSAPASGAALLLPSSCEARPTRLG